MTQGVLQPSPAYRSIAVAHIILSISAKGTLL